MDDCARFLNKAFTACIQHKSSGKESKRWGVYYIIGLVFKTYFEINTLSLCKNILRAVGAMKDLMPLEAYPKAHQVTFKYYTGVLAFLDDRFDKANEDLTFALQKCPVQSRKNQALILTHLIPLRLLQGDLPSQDLLARFPHLEELYRPFVEALKDGNVKHFDEALVRGEKRLVENGTYGIVERVRELCLRGLFKKVWSLNGQQKIIEITKFKRALSVSGVNIDNEEVECLLAGMIFKGYMKGYIAHAQQKVVLSDVLNGKAHPFPNVKTATQSIIESSRYPTLDDDRLEFLKLEHSNLAYKVKLHTQRLLTELKVRDAMQVLGKLDQLDITQSSNKIDEVEKNLSRQRSRLLDVQTDLLHHNAGILAKYINNQKLLQPQSHHSQSHFDGRHFHANNDRAILPSNTSGSANKKSPLYEQRIQHLTTELDGERELNQATLAANESLQEQIETLKSQIYDGKNTTAETSQELMLASEKLDSALKETSKYQQLLQEAQSSNSRQVEHSNSLQNRLQSLLEDFSQIVTTRDGITSSIENLCNLLDTYKISYTKSSQNPLETFNSAISSIETQLMVVKEHSGMSEQMEYLTNEKHVMRQRFEYYENQVQQLSDVVANQKIDTEKQKQDFSSVIGEQKEKIAALEEQLGEANLRSKQLESDLSYYKDNNASYERELKLKEENKHNSGVSESEEKLSVQTLRALWKILPTSTQRDGKERLIESNSATLSQSDVDKLKQVLSRSKERTFEHFDLKTFVQRVKTLIDDNRLFLERILNNAETANLYKSNAEKAHKLALDFKTALEAYKRQVLDLQNNLSQASKRDAEIRKERESLREKISEMERNLSKQQQGSELDKLRKSLVNRDDEIQAFKQLQMDKSLGMLDELNSLQIEVADLRQKLRQKGA
ncbi:hypothetical protein E3Q08_03358 [Wallemia mellicola]|uniref:PCI domain-containing protein n=1 Tax=Wallemia mellicola TaxID=1708541 RepID=A0AB74KB26_9BASI|nr:hypothetical protein E3Q24_03325 [Wallemia mellicola]TIB82321.1 hypothetical protein E3Q21_03423 [Wallemia mellicola]TIB85165.1 hypothetical protein E3Q20_03378 [Wallemia mellicola]TIC02675.1 hypothetical protein E3Q16_03383 [Wallemia mellicola]TIC33709.1 hypothetical protein E3Q09_03379 [Wallemia mellicola]